MRLVDAIMENNRTTFSNVSRACGEMVREFPGVTACRNPTPTAEFNMAFLSDERGTQPGTLREVQGFFGEIGAAWCLMVPPRLTRLYGEVSGRVRISQRRALPEMIMRKGDHVERHSTPGELTITKVRTLKDLKTWSGTAHRGFGIGRRDAFASALNARGLSILGGSSYIGWVSGRPVATSACFATGDIAGVYAIATLPRARGHGYGEALTWAAVEDGFASGCSTISLHASPMGFPIYYRMGFRRIFDFEEWEVPAAPQRL